MATQATTVGPNYVSYNTTKKKVETIKRKDPNLGGFLEGAFGIENGFAGSIGSQVDSIDRYTRNVMQNMFSPEIVAGQQGGGAGGGSGGGGGISSGLDSVADSISGLGSGISSGLAGASGQITEYLKPISSFVGSTLGMLTALQRDPVGSLFALPNTLVALVDTVNPAFANTLDATFKQFKIQDLTNLPSQLFGSLRSLASKLDALLALPLSLIEDLYMGLMNIFKAVSNLLDTIIQAVFDFFFGPGGVLDALIPVSDILAFISEVSAIASQFGSIIGSFTGANFVTNYVGQLQGYTGQITSVLSDPQSLMTSFLPSGSTDFLSMSRNPEQLLNSMIPGEIQGLLSGIGNIPGLGFVSNLGYGLEGVLSGLKGGIISGILSDFEKQLGILSPILNQGGPAATTASSMQSDYPPTVDGALTNPSIPTVKEVPVSLQPRSKVLHGYDDGHGH